MSKYISTGALKSESSPLGPTTSLLLLAILVLLLLQIEVELGRIQRGRMWRSIGSTSSASNIDTPVHLYRALIRQE